MRSMQIFQKIRKTDDVSEQLFEQDVNEEEDFEIQHF